MGRVYNINYLYHNVFLKSESKCKMYQVENSVILQELKWYTKYIKDELKVCKLPIFEGYCVVLVDFWLPLSEMFSLVYVI